MSAWSDLSERLKSVFRRGRQERELDEELRFHLDRDVEERVRAGVDRATARREALIAFGGVERIKEDVRDARGTRPLDDLMADTRAAFRSLRASPSFAVPAILVLGLGLGATTAVFTVVNRVLLAPLPYPEPDRLVRVYHTKDGAVLWQHLSAVDVLGIREQQRVFEAFGAVQRNQAAISGLGRPERLTVGRATAGFFQALGVGVARGRPVAEADETAAARIAVVSDRFARDRLGGPSTAIGRSITIDGIGHEVVGVLAPGIDALAAIESPIWVPLQIAPPTRRGPFGFRLIGRLRPGVTLEDGARDLAGISARLFPVWASSFRDQTATFAPVPLQRSIVGASGEQLTLFAGAVILVLLTAAANVATLMLVRSSARDQELAVRTALGASRGRIAKLLITESLVVTGLAGVVGLALAAVGLRLWIAAVPYLPRIHEVALDGSAIGFAALTSLASGLLVSAPALMAGLVRRSPGSLRLDTRRVGTDRRANTVRRALVVAEFALALPLLVGGALLAQSFRRLQAVDPGFEVSGLVAATISLPSARYPDGAAMQRFWRQLEQRASAVPGVTAAGLTLNLPPNDPNDENNFDLLDRPVAPGANEHIAPWSTVTPGYFAALGVPLLSGRLFTEADSAQGPRVVLVSESWARRYYPAVSAVGKQLISGGCTTCPPTTVIGVVGDVKYLGLGERADGVYDPNWQRENRFQSLVVRTGDGTAATIVRLREVVAGLDPELPVEIATLEERMAESLAAPRRWTAVLGGFAVIAVVLAALGVFGLMSYAVRQRRREIGVRLALGAAPGSVLRMVIRYGVSHASAGVAIGVVLALLGGRWIAGFLYGVQPADPSTIIVVAVILLGAAGLACWLPGRAAARISPIEAIATE
ncbi:MAG: ADOP family duplicated permease [Gemmatimonadales bacterium]